MDQAKERIRWNLILKKLLLVLDLKDWEVHITNKEPEDPGRVAEIERINSRRVARINLGPMFFLCNDIGKLRTIVHELIHLHFAYMDDILRHELEGSLYRNYDKMFEYGVDSLAVAIAKLIPNELTESKN